MVKVSKLNILAIDLGSLETKAVIASTDGKKIRILGVGRQATRGVSKGEIVNMESAVNSISKAIDEASRTCNTTSYQKVVVNISSSYTTSELQKASFNIQRDVFGNGISVNDISGAIKAARDRAGISEDYKIIHVLPVSFKIDSQENIEDPIGMSANGIDVKVHIIKSKITNYQNIKQILERVGIHTFELVSSAYANAIFNCGDNEKQMGSIVIDMGGHTCDISIQNQNSLLYHLNLKVGSHHITNDLSKAVSISLDSAEKIKLGFKEMKSKCEVIDAPKSDDSDCMQSMKIETVSHIMYARVKETLMFLLRLLNEKPNPENSFYSRYSGSGVIFTGGMTKMCDFLEYARAVFHNKAVKLGSCAYDCFEGFEDYVNDRANSCVLGLCMYGAGYFTNYEINSNGTFKTKSEIDKTIITSEKDAKYEQKPVVNHNLSSNNNVLQDVAISPQASVVSNDIASQENKTTNGTKIANEQSKNTQNEANLNIKDIMLDSDVSKDNSKSWFSKIWDKIVDTILKYF